LTSVTVDPVEQIDDVVCSVDVASVDLDSDSVSYSFSWTVDGTPFGGISSDTALSSTISALETATGEVWECTVTPNDGDEDGDLAVVSTTINSDWLGQREFDTCGATGYTGPSQANCTSSYLSTALEGEVTVTSGIQYWTVPADGTYRIEAAGAQGGSMNGTYVGGDGAVMSGEFNLVEGEVLSIVVGQVGIVAGNGSGGGGGSFVVYSGGTTNADILVIAGGGGGSNSHSNYSGEPGLTSTSGGDSNIPNGGSCANNGYGGSNGQGGGAGCAAGGGGFFGNGDVGSHSAGGGTAFLNGATGGISSNGSGFTHGGFGSGGAGSPNNGYGGGGGGYSGGGGGSWSPAGNGGGGGSYNNGTNQSNTSGANSGAGYVFIDKL